MKKLMVAAATIVAAGSAVPAAAATFTFNNVNAQYGTTGVILTANDGVTKANVTAWTATKNSGSGYTITAASLGRYSGSGNSGGLGVIAPGAVAAGGDGNGSGNLHTVDNKGSFDFLVFQFNFTVDPTTAKFNPYLIGTGTADNDASVGVSMSGNPYTTSVNFASTNATNPFGVAMTWDLDNNGNAGVLPINPGNFTGNLLVIGADLHNTDHIDGFKLASLTVAAVPEPKSWATLALGLGLVGASAARRRRSALGLVGASAARRRRSAAA